MAHRFAHHAIGPVKTQRPGKPRDGQVRIIRTSGQYCPSRAESQAPCRTAARARFALAFSHPTSAVAAMRQPTSRPITA